MPLALEYTVQHAQTTIIIIIISRIYLCFVVQVQSIEMLSYMAQWPVLLRPIILCSVLSGVASTLVCIFYT